MASCIEGCRSSGHGTLSLAYSWPQCSPPPSHSLGLSFSLLLGDGHSGSRIPPGASTLPPLPATPSPPALSAQSCCVFSARFRLSTHHGITRLPAWGPGLAHLCTPGPRARVGAEEMTGEGTRRLRDTVSLGLHRRRRGGQGPRGDGQSLAEGPPAASLRLLLREGGRVASADRTKADAAGLQGCAELALVKPLLACGRLPLRANTRCWGRWGSFVGHLITDHSCPRKARLPVNMEPR